jgi:putative ATPase
MKDLEYGKGYEYAHDAAEGTTGMNCLPAALQGTKYYRPTDRGLEREIRQRLEKWEDIKRRSRQSGP